MRKILQLLMLVLMATWGTESYAEYLLIKPDDVGGGKHTWTSGDITISINGEGLELGKWLKSVKKSDWNVERYNGTTGKSLVIPVGADFTVSCNGGIIDFLLFSFNNGAAGLVNHSEHWNAFVAGTSNSGTDVKNANGGSYHGTAGESGNDRCSWWDGRGVNASAVTLCDNRTSMNKGAEQTQGFLWAYVFYHKNSNVTASLTLKSGPANSQFDSQKATVTLNSNVQTSTNINNLSTSSMSVYYTVDGSDPASSSTRQQYSNNIPINYTCNVRAYGQVQTELKVASLSFPSDANVDANFTNLPDTYNVQSATTTFSQKFTKYLNVTLGTGKNGALGTLCHDNYMKVPDGYVAATYTTSTNSKGKINMLTPLVTYQGGKDVVPPKTPVIVQKTSGSTNTAKFINPDYNSSTNSKSGNTSSKTNCLTGNSGYGSSNLQTNDDTSCYYYYLQKESSTDANSRVGFFWAPVTSNTSISLRATREGGPVSSLGAHRVYFKCKKSVAKAKGFVFQAPWDDDDNSATSIVAITTETNEANNPDAPMYNAAGQRVGASYKGIVIQNGRKFIKR